MATFIIEDTTPPTLQNIPENITALCEADIAGDNPNVMANDNCDGSVTLSYEQINGFVGQDTQYIVNIWTATDCAGNETVEEQIVTYIPKRPSLDLVKSSTLTPTQPVAGDTIFYDFEITNDGNATLYEIELEDDQLDFVSCNIDSIKVDETVLCVGWYILDQEDLNNGSVCNSASVTGETIDNIPTVDTSDSGNLADELGTDKDKTFTYINQNAEIELIKVSGGTIDVNNNGIVDLGDSILYDFTVINSGNVSLSNISIADSIVDVTGGPISLEPGEMDNTSFKAAYEITTTDVAIGYVENSAIVTGDTPDSMGEIVASDVSDNGDSNVESADGEGNFDNDATNDPVVICVVGNFAYPENEVVDACLSEMAISDLFNSWIDQFEGGGCGTNIVFIGDQMAPSGCGGTTEITFQIQNENGDVIPGMSITRTFVVEADDIDPVAMGTLPDISIAYDSDGCFVTPYASINQLEGSTQVSISDNCSSDTEIVISFEDSIEPSQCEAGDGHMSERTIQRTYTLTDYCGNETSLEQDLTISFTGCNQLDTYGEIAIDGKEIITVSPGCVPPIIEETVGVTGDCDYVDHMWLVSTQEVSPGQPFFPNSFNIGITWFIIDDADDIDYQSSAIDVNTYFVRCSRDISCCDFGESNIVSVLVDPAASCDFEDIVVDDCDEAIILQKPGDNMLDNSSVLYKTNKTIEANIEVNGGSNLILDAKEGVLLKKDFEVAKGATLEVNLEGCKED